LIKSKLLTVGDKKCKKAILEGQSSISSPRLNITPYNYNGNLFFSKPGREKSWDEFLDPRKK